jgi:hypothetical protein
MVVSWWISSAIKCGGAAVLRPWVCGRNWRVGATKKLRVTRGRRELANTTGTGTCMYVPRDLAIYNVPQGII